MGHGQKLTRQKLMEKSWPIKFLHVSRCKPRSLHDTWPWTWCTWLSLTLSPDIRAPAQIFYVLHVMEHLLQLFACAPSRSLSALSLVQRPCHVFMDCCVPLYIQCKLHNNFTGYFFPTFLNVFAFKSSINSWHTLYWRAFDLFPIIGELFSGELQSGELLSGELFIYPHHSHRVDYSCY